MLTSNYNKQDNKSVHQLGNSNIDNASPLQKIQDHHRGNICTLNKQRMELHGTGGTATKAVVPTGSSAPGPKLGRWRAGGCQCCSTRHCPSWRRSWTHPMPWYVLKAGSIRSRGIWRCRPGHPWRCPQRGWGRQLWAGWWRRAALTNLVHRMKHYCDIHGKISHLHKKDNKEKKGRSNNYPGILIGTS